MRKSEEPYVPKAGIKYESEDLRLRPVFRLLFFFFLFTGAAGVLTAGIFQILVPGGFASTTAQDPLHRRLPPTALPRLQDNVAVKKDIADLRASENAALAHVGWVDRSKGIVQIPIDRAMELTAERGLSAWPAPKETGAKTPAKGGVK